jgi:hypothetical protein
MSGVHPVVLPLRAIEIRVVRDSVVTVLRDFEDSTPEPTAAFEVDPWQKKKIDLLAGILRNAMDFDSPNDNLQEKRYRSLLEVLGQELFELLFRDEVRTLVLSALNLVRLKKIRLRLSLNFSNANPKEMKWLESLPWEYVFAPIDTNALGPEGGFLAGQTELVLSRRLGVGSRSVGNDATPIRVLLVCASPTAPSPKTPALDRVSAGPMLNTLRTLESEELITLETLIDEPPGPDDEDPDDYEWQVTRKAFAERVSKTNPVLIHFVGHGRCHGGSGQLAFSKRNGQVDWVPDEQFSEMATALPSLKAVFLQACESAALPDPYVGFSGVAAKLAGAGIPAVIGMQYRVAAPVADTFANAFYTALADEDAADMAVKAGRAALSGDPKWWKKFSFGLPVLYLSSYNAIAHRGASWADKRLAAANGHDWHGHCPYCGVGFPAHHQYCGGCGRKLPPYCRNCGRFNQGNPTCECGERFESEPRDADLIVEADATEVVPTHIARELQGPADLP